MNNVIKKIEYYIAKMIYEDIDYIIDDEYNISFNKNDNEDIVVVLSMKLNYELKFDKIFNYECVNNFTYKFSRDILINDIINNDVEELFVTRYKNNLQLSEKMLLYLSIDNENEFIYNEYKQLLKDTIHQLN